MYLKKILKKEKKEYSEESWLCELSASFNTPVGFSPIKYGHTQGNWEISNRPKTPFEEPRFKA